MTTTEATRHHVSRLFGRDSLYMALWGVQVVCAALLTPIITRVLGAGEFGTVTSANAAMQIIFVLAGLGLQMAIQREWALDPVRARRLLTFAVYIAVALSMLAYATASAWSRPLNMTDQLPVLRLAVLWAGFSAVTAASLALLRSQERLAAFATVSLIQSVIAEAASLILIKFHSAEAIDFLYGQVGAQLLAMALGLVLAPPAVLRLGDRALLLRALRFALPLVPSVLSVFLLSTGDRLVIGAILGSEEVARYQVAYNVAAMPMLLLSVLNSAWMPRFFALGTGAEAREVFAESRDALYRLLVPLVIGFALGAPLVLRIWAPPSYRPEDLHVVVSLVLITTIPFAAQLAIERLLMADGRTTAIAVSTLLAAGGNLLLNLLLVPVWGLVGSAVATLLAYILLFAALNVAGRRVPVRGTPLSLLAQLGAACLLALGSAALPDDPILLTVRAVLVLGTVAWFLRRLVRVSR
jgi:O-antigen/teichoic acid export membrane protein